MNLLINGQQTDTWNMVLLTGVPCILTCKGSSETGTKAKGLLGFTDLSGLTAGKEYTVYINGHPLTSTNDYTEAAGTKFYLPTTDSTRNRIAATHSLMRAAQNVPDLAANYDMYLDYDYSDGNMYYGFNIAAKGYGSAFTLTVTNDLPQTAMNWSLDSGSSNSEFAKGTENILYVDIYRYNTAPRMGNNPVAADTTYVTTLSRRVATDSADFDLAPVLEATTDYGSLSEYRFVVYLMQDGFCNSEDVLDGIYAGKGYSCNQSLGWLPRATNATLLANLSRGEAQDVTNYTIPYIYYKELPLTLLTPTEAGTQVTATVRYLNSDYTIISQSNFSAFPTASITDATWQLGADFDKASYVEVLLPSSETYRFKITKPVRMVDEADCQRVLWRNEYGGISFFDFTGGKTETRKSDVETYDKSHYGYHADARRSLSVPYDKQVKVTVTLETHWLEKDALWMLYSLQNSRSCWTEVNGKVYDIIVSDVKVTESTNNAGVFKGSITYTYSLADTL